MSLMLERAESWRTTVENAGLRVSIDPRNLNPPCVILYPPEIDYVALGSIRLTWTWGVCAPPPGNLDAWAVMADVLDVLRGVIPIVRAVPRTAFTTGDGTPIPNYEITFTEYVREGEGS